MLTCLWSKWSFDQMNKKGSTFSLARAISRAVLCPSKIKVTLTNQRCEHYRFVKFSPQWENPNWKEAERERERELQIQWQKVMEDEEQGKEYLVDGEGNGGKRQR